jgi:predicted amidohydrolase
MDKITKVGFYNPEKPQNPLKTFRSLCERKGKDHLNGSLIVLPEAFNVGICYSRHDAAIQKDPRILGQLQKVCSDFAICVVAGLIISSPTDQGRYPYNSAYLIDDSGASLLCHKMTSDNQGPYTNCRDGCDGHNAILYRDVALLSLICMDAYTRGDKQRQERLSQKLAKALETAVRIVCIPAYIEEDGPGKEFIAIPKSYRVVANSASRSKFENSPGSFVDYIDEEGKTERLVRLEDVDPSPCVKLYSFNVGV